jgi:outer membrane biosynthesis protein TonB
VIAAGLLLAVTALFTPPRVVSGDPPALPAPTVVGGGEVLIEAMVDRSGVVKSAVLLRETPPYGQIVMDAISRWRFAPALAHGDNGDQPVDAPVLIAALYRPPVFLNGPTLGTVPLDLRASQNTPYPVMMPMPTFPPLALFGGVVILEASLDEAGITRSVRTIQSAPPFDSAAREAVSQWRFRGATFRSLPVPSRAYIVLGFTPPVVTVQ